MPAATSYHMSLCLDGALNHWTPAQFARKFKDAFTDSNGKPMDPLVARTEIQMLYDRGVRKSSGCDEFDHVKGCPGHPVTD